MIQRMADVLQKLTFESLKYYSKLKATFLFLLFISLTVGASRLIEAQMDLPSLLFDVDFQIFIVTPQMFRFSREYVENVRG